MELALYAQQNEGAGPKCPREQLRMELEQGLGQGMSIYLPIAWHSVVPMRKVYNRTRLLILRDLWFVDQKVAYIALRHSYERVMGTMHALVQRLDMGSQPP